MRSLPNGPSARKAGAIPVRLLNSSPEPQPEPCPHCGGPTEARREPPSSIHFARLACSDCGRHVRWLPFAGLDQGDQESLNLFKAAVVSRARGRKGDLPRLIKALKIRGWDVAPVEPARRWGGPAR